MPRTLARTLTTLASSLLLLVLTALPALAASGTKPDPAKDPNLVGSMDQLLITMGVGVVLGILAYAMLGKDTTPADDHH